MNIILLCGILTASAPVQDPPANPQQPVEGDEVKVVGSSKSPLDRIDPPAFFLDDLDLRRFLYDDVNRVLRMVPGVYLREEDGYGLRPNIGIRGTTTERSGKVTLMEDGILLAPAPYAAPAAYYFPLMSRMAGVETITGPAILQYGPLTVGGAINMTTRPIPDRFSAGAELAAGSFGYRKAHLWTGHEAWSGGVGFGFLVEGAAIASGGFKELDSGGDTGFEKSEFMVKGGVRFGGDGSPAQSVVVKAGFADETSDETYLGLTDEDFAENPFRRYRASQNDRMDWDRTQFELFHEIELAKNTSLRSAVYHHDFDRAWNKVNRFRNGPALNTLLANPAAGTNAVFFAVLTGAQDSSNSDEDLMIGTNDRRFLAQGVQTDFRWSDEDERRRIRQAVHAGIRFHRDEAVRLHTEDAHSMTGGSLVHLGEPQLVNTDTTASAEAIAFHGAYTHRFGSWVVTPRLRVESIRTELENHASGADASDSSSILLPGFLAAWELSETWTAQGGVYRGFSPEAPGQADNVDPEESVNYEVGARFETRSTRVGATWFFNDYGNLAGEDTFAGGGSGTGQQFNGGEVDITGLECSARHEIALAASVSVPLSLTYTYLHSEFLTTFSSQNPEFGDVESGDELPYLPEHQLTASVGVEGGTWRVSFLVNYVGEMREVAGQDDPVDYEKVPARSVFDVSASWNPVQEARLFVTVLNALDEEYLVSHRPYGARPGMPRQIQFGCELGF